MSYLYFLATLLFLPIAKFKMSIFIGLSPALNLHISFFVTPVWNPFPNHSEKPLFAQHIWTIINEVKLIRINLLLVVGPTDNYN